jgi:hypothetical protein
VEVLEDRTLLTTYTITTGRDLLNDANPNNEVTLRDALTAISTQAPSGNAPAGTASNTIRFAIAPLRGSNVVTINVGIGSAGSLPVITHQVFIDGWSEAGLPYSGPPLVALSGESVNGGPDGLVFGPGSDGSVVRGLDIRQFRGNGIVLNGTSGNLITANFIGTDPAGNATSGNANDGVLLSGGARANTVGGTTRSAGNLISGNGNGVEISGSGTSGNVVLGNLIGTDQGGTVALGNVKDGILIGGGATGNTVGGKAAGSANVLVGGLVVVPGGGNTVNGGAVFALGPATISGNIARFDVAVNYADTPPAEMVFLGVDVRSNAGDPLAPIDPNTLQADFSAFQFFPSNALGPGWVPVDNALPGEYLFHTPPPPGTQPPSGLAPNATYPVGTLTYDLSKFGITPDPSLTISISGTDTTIGTEQQGNPATFHFVDPTFATSQQPIQNGGGTAGVEVRDGGTSGNLVLGNLIGTDKGGATDLGQLTEGVLIDGGATQNTVGGTSAAAANVIAGNDDGVVLSGAGTSGNAVAGNSIGTDRTGTADLGNTLAGVLLEDGASANTVGGTAAGSGNTIAFNGKGVVIGSSPSDVETHHDAVLGNSVYGSTGPAVELGNQGETANGANPRAFPNDGQNNPLLTSVTPHAVSGSLTSAPNTSYRIEFFANPVSGGVAKKPTFLGTMNVTTGAAGTASFTLPIATLPPGAAVTATATNRTTGDTSGSSPAGTQLMVTSSPAGAAGGRAQVVTFTAQVSTGSVPITSGLVTFTVVGLPGQVTATPDANGVVTVRFTLPAGTKPGQYTVVATYLGGEGRPAVTAVGTLTVKPPIGLIKRRWVR